MLEKAWIRRARALEGFPGRQEDGHVSEGSKNGVQEGGV